MVGGIVVLIKSVDGKRDGWCVDQSGIDKEGIREAVKGNGASDLVRLLDGISPEELNGITLTIEGVSSLFILKY